LNIHTTFLIFGLVSLAVIFLVDIELTLSRSRPIQYRGEDEWGFGQMLALLLLVVVDVTKSRKGTDIQKKIRERKQDHQWRFESSLLSWTTLSWLAISAIILRQLDGLQIRAHSLFITLLQNDIIMN
jgi:hypothetical protein